MKKVIRMQKEGYWRLKSKWTRIKLVFQNKKYKMLRSRVNKESEKVYNIPIVKLLTRQLSLGIITLLSMYLADYFVRRLINSDVYFIREVRNYIKEYLTLKLNFDLFSDWIIGAVGISGVFLGLYYSNISSIFTSKYSNAPKEMRELFTNELITNKNIDYVIKYMVIALMVLLVNSMGISPGYVTMFFMFILTARVIITFSLIGKRTYGFSDTYFIAEPMFRFILLNIKNVTVFGYKWDDRNFQNHYKIECSQFINNLRIINSYNLEDKHVKSESMLNFMRTNLFILTKYLRSKKYIPYDSYWFKDKYEYNRWYEANDNEVAIAINTGTTIRPITKKDYYWFEEEILKINELCLKKFINVQNTKAILEYSNMFCEMVGVLSEICIPSITVKIIRNFDNIITEYLNSINKDEIMEMALAESLNRIYLDYIINSSNLLKNNNIIKKFNFSEKNLYSKKSVLKLGYTFLNNSNIHKLFEAIDMEFKIEKRKITPDWYIQQHIYEEIYNFLIELCNSILNIYNNYIYKIGCKYLSEKNYKYAMIYFFKESEFYNKINLIFPIIEELEKIVTERRFLIDANLRENIIFSIKENIIRIHKDMPNEWVKCVVGFIDTKFIKSKDYPDFLGFCYNNVCEYLISALEENNFESFKLGYDNFLPLCLIYQNIIKEDLAENNKYSSIYSSNMIISPVVEFFEISGYAIILGEFTENEVWKELIKSYIDNMSEKLLSDNKDIFERWISFINIKRKSIMIMYRDRVIFDWKSRFNKSIIDNKLVKYKSQGYFGGKKLDTKSKFLNDVYSIDDQYLNINIDASEIYGIFIINKYLSKDKRLVSSWKWEKNLGDDIYE
ncbi:hypothetical protein [Clostridium beijerinckii]|uniref:hypothetical protein n=1 Tax=Clostridium beijerinckii TaxID=1520 RepID=UPI00098BFB6E|nr:hypothetical protein [Clostridium beijerinckii]NRT78223.1 hypothetical protein [Clostridium beijerinckii]OOM47921.1 hypothetical protein CBEIJ_26610 [Clostridium beijerinckii]